MWKQEAKHKSTKGDKPINQITPKLIEDKQNCKEETRKTQDKVATIFFHWAKKAKYYYFLNALQKYNYKSDQTCHNRAFDTLPQSI